MDKIIKISIVKSQLFYDFILKTDKKPSFHVYYNNYYST